MTDSDEELGERMSECGARTAHAERDMNNYKVTSVFKSNERKMILSGLASSLFFILFSMTDLGSRIESYASFFFGQAASSNLNQEASISPNLKVIIFDNAATLRIGKNDLDQHEWNVLLQRIAGKNPKKILIDKNFSKGTTLKNIEQFKRDIDQLGLPFAMRIEVLDDDRAEHSNVPTGMSFGVKIEDLLGGYDEVETPLPGVVWPPIEATRFSDEALHFAGLMPKVGYSKFEPFGRVKPMIRINERTVFPHLALYAADKIRLVDSEFTIDDRLLPLDNRGYSLPIMLSLRTLLSKSISLPDILDQKNSEETLSQIGQDDIVLIQAGLPFAAKGATENWRRPEDFEGVFTASMVNSVLTGQWIKFYRWNQALTLFAAGLGLIISLWRSSFLALLAMMGVALFWATYANFAFAYAKVLIPWVLPIFSLVATFILTFRIRTRAEHAKEAAVTGALTGRMSQEYIDYLLKRPELLESEPEGRIFTIMFIDIEGFSQISEHLTPRQAFIDLKELFDLMRWHVMRHGGVVDKVMGDGMLCFFGYGPRDQVDARQHAFEGVMCAIEIQRAILARNLSASANLKAIYPLRIGINTSNVFFGNIGDDENFDFTLIGNGVNLAKRFEAACQHYRVVIGAATYDLLAGQPKIPASLTKKLIPIKHAEAPFEAYEVDPFFGQDKTVMSITAAYRLYLGITRKDPRWPVPKDVDIVFVSSFGDARLSDFSISGLSVVLPQYIGNGVTLDLLLVIPDHISVMTLGSLLSLHVEVRWGRAIGDGFLHGVQIKNLSVSQKEDLIFVFREIIRGSTRLSLSAS